jgi:hypothetical protein
MLNAFDTRNPRLLLHGGKLVVSRFKDILAGKFSVHAVHGIRCQTLLQFSKLVQLQQTLKGRYSIQVNLLKEHIFPQ